MSPSNIDQNEDDRLVGPEPQGDDAAGTNLRPRTLREFIGQRQARENLQVFIEAARSRQEALDHVLLFGPPGLKSAPASFCPVR
ncbi:MAG: hypothetical protein ABL951_16795, partial [Alphaproteobacteria bacterium]